MIPPKSTVQMGRAPYIESSAIVWSMQSRISMPGPRRETDAQRPIQAWAWSILLSE
jgi:hypothetical protein